MLPSWMKVYVYFSLCAWKIHAMLSKIHAQVNYVYFYFSLCAWMIHKTNAMLSKLHAQVNLIQPVNLKGQHL